MGPSVSFSLPSRIAKKLPIRISWELQIGKLPIPLPGKLWRTHCILNVMSSKRIDRALFKGWFFPGVGHEGSCRGVGGGFLLFSPTVWVGFGGGEEGPHTQHTHTHTHTGTHTGTYTRMLHLPFSDLPLKSARIDLIGIASHDEVSASRQLTLNLQKVFGRCSKLEPFL